MPICSKCGQSSTGEGKFCPSCGTPFGSVTAQKEVKDYKEKMYKNTVMSLKKEGQNYAQSKAKEVLSSLGKEKAQVSETTEPISKVFKSTESQSSKVQQETKTTKNLNKWTWIYLIISAIVAFMGYHAEDVLVVILFSVIVLFLVFLRRKKPKPYNWLVKIILVVQILVLTGSVILRLEYFSVVTLLMISLLITEFILLFKGNNS